jgi:glucose/arabinose dehydrogenase
LTCSISYTEQNGHRAEPQRDILSGFRVPDERESYGRPAGVVVGADDRSLLMATDVGNVVWRVPAA